jgi:hypothetical protein
LEENNNIIRMEKISNRGILMETEMGTAGKDFFNKRYENLPKFPSLKDLGLKKD